MKWAGISVILIGIYLYLSGYRNRDPWGTIVELIKDPSDITGTLESMNGKWQVRQMAAPQTTNTTQSSVVLGSHVSGKNGQLADSQLQALSWAKTKKLTPAAANSFEQLNAAFKAKFGSNIAVTDAYRSYSEQVAVKAKKGYLAATPGTSNHGWGLAVDLGSGINNWNTTQHKWMDENAFKFGWVNPDWAKPGKGKEEPWHWEYTRATAGGGGM